MAQAVHRVSVELPASRVALIINHLFRRYAIQVSLVYVYNFRRSLLIFCYLCLIQIYRRQ